MGTWKRISFPADARDILTVGAINPSGVNAPFSSIGPTADGRIKPDVMAFGSPTEVVTGHGAILNDMGTSFASPLIAGMVACLWQALPGKTALQIIDLVKRSSDRYTHPDNVFGYGVPDFWKAYQLGKGKSQ
jgi:subtilisin family serine protease